MNSLTVAAKQHAKEHKTKFVQVVDQEHFITCKSFPVKAGMKMENGKVTDYKIKVVGKETIYFLNKLWFDGDIQLIDQAKNILSLRIK